MPDRVAIVGVGHTQFRATSPGLSYKELMFEAATKAYADAGIDPRRDIDSFVCCSEDLSEGTGIFDEYVPDQIGAAMRPVHTIAGDGLQGVVAAYMQGLHPRHSALQARLLLAPSNAMPRRSIWADPRITRQPKEFRGA